ncbi:MAG: hypothetical protein HKN50_08990, partial [Gammaproteobacteria bacterium]|nr:hypothetical protein [Gammaproteobacteria bacterium]
MLNTIVSRFASLRNASILFILITLAAPMAVIQTAEAKMSFDADAMLIDVKKLKKDRAQERADKLHERALRKAGWKRVFKDEFKGKRIREKNW